MTTNLLASSWKWILLVKSTSLLRYSFYSQNPVRKVHFSLSYFVSSVIFNISYKSETAYNWFTKWLTLSVLVATIFWDENSEVKYKIIHFCPLDLYRSLKTAIEYSLLFHLSSLISSNHSISHSSLWMRT